MIYINKIRLPVLNKSVKFRIYMAEYLVSDGTGIMEEKTRWLYDEESNHCACVCASVESTMPAFLTFIVLRRRVGLR